MAAYPPPVNAGRILHPGYVSGATRRYGPPCTSTATTAPLAANTLYAQPLPILFPLRVSGLEMRGGTAVAAARGKLALYSNAGALVAECVSDLDLNVGAVAIPAAFSGNVTLSPQVYWACFVTDGLAQPTLWNAGAAGGGGIAWLLGAASVSGLVTGVAAARLTAALTFGAANTPFFPAVLPTLTLGSGNPGSPYICAVAV